ncbi:hypothetical protein [Corynebacterium pseudopelargi]|uniref:Uncharacterized protein n=1 Tax=Corynebacterium pseudopelargi TaxID=2080757 RepID=A0A3G6IW52_9CORY|nr:hypothetical protein [Corynebacterium pseudopelargi]AZA10015.1 hypothetical protein CPPEL_09560 [Corynebacterium pseudopelargi]
MAAKMNAKPMRLHCTVCSVNTSMPAWGLACKVLAVAELEKPGHE